MSELTDALLHAVDEVCDDLGAIADSVAGPDDLQATTDADVQARNQFLHAFAALLREGIRGGREQREFVMQTAVPALLANGQTTLEMVRGHVAFYMALSPHLLAAVPEHLREEASSWLAVYAAEYTRDVLDIALSAQADAP